MRQTPTITTATPPATVRVLDIPPGRAAAQVSPVTPGASVTRYDTPLLPTSIPVPAGARATLTVLTGMYAGALVTVDTVPVTVGRDPDADLVVEEMGVSRHHVRVVPSPDGSFYAQDLGSTNGTFLHAERIGVAVLETGDLLQLGPHVRVRFAVVDAEAEALYRRLYESSVHDTLTRVFNRKYLGDRLLAETAHARRTGADVAVLMIDLDHFKEINDRFGHLAGDRALCTVSARILRVLRVEDMLARYGGDEFVVLAVGTGGHEALHLAERARRAVEGLHLSARGREVPITVSIGLASLAELGAAEAPWTALIALADARMYCAKAAGRNRVCASD